MTRTLHLICCYPLQQFRGRLVLRVLFDQPAADGEVEDGLAEAGDLVGAGGQGGQGVDGEARVGAEGCGVRVGRAQPGEAGRSQPVAPFLPRRARRLQPVAQRHQFIDLRHDTLLLCKGREGDQEGSQS